MSLAHGIDEPVTASSVSYPPKEEVSNDRTDDDDIWASSDGEVEIEATDKLSDTVKIRRDHFNTGYIDGITATKDSALQSGFDEGYPLGAEIGQQAGEIIGYLQGHGLKDLEKSATLELSAERLFSKTYWNSSTERAWEGELHPLIHKWQTLVSNLANND